MELGFYDYDLINNLETQVDLYEQDRQIHWENQSETGTIDSALKLDRAERFAKTVLKNSEQLIPVQEIDADLSSLQYEINRVPEFEKKWNDIVNSDLPEDKIHESLRELFKDRPEEPQSEESPLRLLWERFVIDMSWEAIRKIEEGASRIFRLYKLVLISAPSESTQRFLSRLSRCFVWGFDPECIILCRAVIDTAFRDTVSDEVCEKHFGKNGYEFNLSKKIQAAYKEGIINDQIKNKAFRIKNRGDKAVHYQPDITRNVWETICDTLAVLEEIT